MNWHVRKERSVSGTVKVVLVGFLFFLLVTSPFDTPARAQQPPHEHDWQALGEEISAPYIWLTNDQGNTIEYLRCGEVARLNVASIIDMDQCKNYDGFCEYNNWEMDIVELKEWSDNNAGGKFGYLDGNGNFVESGTQISHLIFVQKWRG